jgi:signal transduction histidine kinase
MRFMPNAKAQGYGGGSRISNPGWVAVRRTSCAIWICVLSASVLGGSVNSPAPGGSNVVSLAELQRAVSQEGRIIQSFRIEGIVCAVASNQKLLAVQDSSACALLEVPALDGTIQAGDWVAITANYCAVTRSRFGIQLGTAPVVNNDGHHPAFAKSGEVFLESGFQPFRLTWFNGVGGYGLQLDYEGPHLPRQTVPPSAFWRKPAGRGAQENFQPGLDFDAYIGNWAVALPDFQSLAPVSHGVATNLDLHYSVRVDNAALAFNGYLKITNAGKYTFYLTSDDGGNLYVGNPEPSCQTTTIEHRIVPVPRRFNGTLSSEDHSWTEVEGEVTFAAPYEQELDLELAVKGERVQLAVVDGSSLFPKRLLHQWVKAVGIFEALSDVEQKRIARLVVPGPGQLDMIGLTNEARYMSQGTNKILASIEEIRNLTRAEAEEHLPAKIRGVVIWSSPTAVVLQDARAGVYVHYNSTNWMQQPSVGELWEIEGTTDPGDFSPVLLGIKGTFLQRAALPEPIRPTRNQLVNGSLDAEYVELRGALTGISETNMTLLSPEGKITILTTDDHPLPYLPPPSRRDGSFVDSIVRIRGCLTARWDKAARQVRAREIFISPGFVQVEELAPADPFDLPTRRAADLLWFDPSGSTLERTKIKGQIVFARPGEYCLQDGSTGLRLRTKQPLDLQAGDVVEAVGFPQLGGPSPTLQEAQARVIGKLALPSPLPIAATDLLNMGYDSTVVRVEAVLLSDRSYRRERVLELQASQNHFIARLKSNQPVGSPLVTGSVLQLTGVYFAVGSEQASGNLDAFELKMNNPADILLLQQPPWWTLSRALALMAVLAGVLAIALVWITLLRRKVEERTVQLQKQIGERQLVEQRRVMEQERTRVAQDLHDELGAGLTEMGFLGDLVKNPAVPAPEKQRYLGQMTDTARSLVTALDEIVWAVNPRYDSVPSLASYYTLFAQRFLDLAGVACRPQMPASFPDYPLDAKGRHGLFLAFKEALNNVVRHSGATEVNLRIEVGKGELIIFVADNGRGFDSATNGTEGEGLRSMRNRLEQLGGIFAIKSRPGAGTQVELRLPVGNHVL